MWCTSRQCLRPTSFSNIYINDIIESSTLLKFFLFADDTTIFYSCKPNDHTEQILNNELAQVSNCLVLCVLLLIIVLQT